MGTGPIPIDVGDDVEAYLYEKFYDSIDFIFKPPEGTSAKDLDVKVTSTKLVVGLRGRSPYAPEPSRLSRPDCCV